MIYKILPRVFNMVLTAPGISGNFLEFCSHQSVSIKEKMSSVSHCYMDVMPEKGSLIL